MGPCGPAPQQGKPRCIAAFRTFLEKFWLNLGVIFVHFSNLHFWLKSLEGPRGAELKTVEGGGARGVAAMYIVSIPAPRRRCWGGWM